MNTFRVPPGVNPLSAPVPSVVHLGAVAGADRAEKQSTDDRAADASRHFSERLNRWMKIQRGAGRRMRRPDRGTHAQGRLAGLSLEVELPRPEVLNAREHRVGVAEG